VRRLNCRVTAIEAALLIRPPALRGVSDFLMLPCKNKRTLISGKRRIAKGRI
jgi:hypothetical protein